MNAKECIEYVEKNINSKNYKKLAEEVPIFISQFDDMLRNLMHRTVMLQDDLHTINGMIKGIEFADTPTSQVQQKMFIKKANEKIKSAKIHLVQLKDIADAIATGL